MNKIIERMLNKAFKSKKDIIGLIPGEQGNLAMFFFAPIVIDISKKTNKKIMEVKK